MRLKKLEKKPIWDANYNFAIFGAQQLEWAKPGKVAFTRDSLFDLLQRALPNFLEVVVHKFININSKGLNALKGSKHKNIEKNQVEVKENNQGSRKEIAHHIFPYQHSY
ncbi:MAG: hypothetical protein ABIE92_02535 [bacterium]